VADPEYGVPRLDATAGTSAVFSPQFAITNLQLAICNRDHRWAVNCKLFIEDCKLTAAGSIPCILDFSEYLNILSHKGLRRSRARRTRPQ